MESNSIKVIKPTKIINKILYYLCGYVEYDRQYVKNYLESGQLQKDMDQAQQPQQSERHKQQYKQSQPFKGSLATFTFLVEGNGQFGTAFEWATMDDSTIESTGLFLYMLSSGNLTENILQTILGSCKTDEQYFFINAIIDEYENQKKIQTEKPVIRPSQVFNRLAGYYNDNNLVVKEEGEQE